VPGGTLCVKRSGRPTGVGAGGDERSTSHVARAVNATVATAAVTSFEDRVGSAVT